MFHFRSLRNIYIYGSFNINIYIYIYTYTYIHIYVSFGATAPRWTMASSFRRFLYHTQWHTVGRTPLDEWSGRRRDLYLTTHNFHAPGGIRTHIRNRRAAADLRLRPRGHWDRRILIYDKAYVIIVRCLVCFSKRKYSTHTRGI